MGILNRLIANPLGIFAVLSLAAFLESYGDSYFQVGVHRSTGWSRVIALLAGVVVLAGYGLLVNIARWDFGKLLGIYVVLFFVMAQVLNKVRFGQSPTVPIYAGGVLIVAGGMVIAFWKG